MWNIERQFLNPFIRKAMHRYMQFSPSRYPTDYDFTVRGTMGIVAREFEQAALTGLLSNIPPDAPQHALILRAIMELSGSPKRDEILAKLDKLNEPTPEQQAQQQLQQAMQQEALKEQQLENAKTEAEIALIMAQIEHQKKMTDLEDEKVDIQAANVALGREKVKAQKEQTQVNREKNLIDAAIKEKQGAQKAQKSS